jgi:arylsulfatase A-like enzyme
LIISGPGVPTARIDEQVRHVDLVPTLLDLTGIDAPPNIDGRSVVPLMRGGSLPEKPAYMEAVGVKLEGQRIMGARTPDWKLLKRQGAQPALFKLNGSTGPDEKHNLVRKHPEVARPLEAFIDRVSSTEVVAESGMTADEEATVEQHLRDLGYL